jgi:hypothetical protein
MVTSALTDDELYEAVKVATVRYTTAKARREAWFALSRAVGLMEQAYREAPNIMGNLVTQLSEIIETNGERVAKLQQIETQAHDDLQRLSAMQRIRHE